MILDLEVYRRWAANPYLRTLFGNSFHSYADYQHKVKSWLN